MPRTVLTPIAVPSAYAIVPVALAFTAWDAANGNKFISTGREILLVKNAHATLAKTVTIPSVADDQGRTGDITAYSIPALATYTFQQFAQDGWKQSDGYINVDGSTTDIQFCVLQLP